MSQLPDLLAPVAPPASADKPPRQRERADTEGPSFSDRLDAQRDEKAAKPAREATSQDDPTPTQGADAADETATREASGTENPAADEQAENDGVSTPTSLRPESPALTAEPQGTEVQIAELLGSDEAALVQQSIDSEVALTATTAAPMTLIAPTAEESSAEPGALARWFAKASAPSGQLVSEAAKAGQPQGRQLVSGLSGDMEGSGVPQLAQSARPIPIEDAAMTFADALASSNADAEGLDSFVSQAVAKMAANGDSDASALTMPSTGQTMTTGAQAAITAVPQATTGQAVPVSALAVEISRQVMNGKTQFDIRLDPPELGRISVRLEMDGAGQTRTHLIVERAETLEMLTTDARNLERALQQAGLKAEPGSISFELAQDMADGFDPQGKDANADDQSGDASGTANSDDPSRASDPDELAATPEAIRHQLTVTGHLDVRI